jgi:hypothetical protein
VRKRLQISGAFAIYSALIVEGRMSRVNFAGYKVRLPGNPLLRMALGIGLVLGGLLGFMPVLGFWMIPLGLAVLGVDFPPVRRFYRRLTVKLGYLLRKRWPALARRLGYGEPRAGRSD